MANDGDVMKGKHMVASALAVVVLAVVVIMGVAVLEGFSKELRVTTTTANSANVAATVAAVNTTTTFTGLDFVQTIESCNNGSTAAIDNLTAANYTLVEGAPGSTEGGLVLLDGGASFAGGPLNCTVTYLATSSTQTETDKFVVGLGIFGTFISIIVLAIVAIIVIGLFVKTKKGSEE